MSINLSKLHREKLINELKEIKQLLFKSNNENKKIEQYINDIEQELNNHRYGLIFEDHREHIDELLLESIPVFTEKKELDICRSRNNKVNFLIEGDNLPALKVLENTHKESIDYIYIDPPYNTKNKDFIYDDSYVDENDSFRHSKWLSFMEKRLLLAYKLLSPKGCIMISINEEELFELKMLCDQIFGTTNYLTMFSVKVRHEDRILKGDKDFHEVMEYMLMYRKTSEFNTVKRIKDNTSVKDYLYEIIEIKNSSETIEMDGKQVQVFKPGEYEINKVEPNKINLKKINIRGSIKEGNSSGRFFMKHLDRFIGEKPGYLYKVPNMGDDGLGFRYFLIPSSNKRVNGDYFQGVPIGRKDTKEIPFSNYLDFEKEFNNVGYEGYVQFRNGKKPLGFLNKCFELGGVLRNKNSIVLDFFAGSGSTGHALMKLNNEDKGNRSFILITNNQNNICRDITYSRLKNVIKNDNYNENLKYYCVDFIHNNDKVYYEYLEELLKHIKELIQIENGIDLEYSTNVQLVFTDEELYEIINKNLKCKKLYIGCDVLISNQILKKLNDKNIEIITIPDYFYPDIRRS